MRKLIIIFLFVLSTAAVHAGGKNKAVYGSITGSDNEGLSGAKIEVSGTDIVVYSDFDGNFTIDNLKPGQYDLVVSYISFQNLELQKVHLNYKNDENLTLRLNAR